MASKRERLRTKTDGPTDKPWQSSIKVAEKTIGNIFGRKKTNDVFISPDSITKAGTVRVKKSLNVRSSATKVIKGYTTETKSGKENTPKLVKPSRFNVLLNGEPNGKERSAKTSSSLSRKKVLCPPDTEQKVLGKNMKSHDRKNVKSRDSKNVKSHESNNPRKNSEKVTKVSEVNVANDSRHLSEQKSKLGHSTRSRGYISSSKRGSPDSLNTPNIKAKKPRYDDKSFQENEATSHKKVSRKELKSEHTKPITSTRGPKVISKTTSHCKTSDSDKAPTRRGTRRWREDTTMSKDNSVSNSGKLHRRAGRVSDGRCSPTSKMRYVDDTAPKVKRTKGQKESNLDDTRPLKNGKSRRNERPMSHVGTKSSCAKAGVSVRQRSPSVAILCAGENQTPQQHYFMLQEETATAPSVGNRCIKLDGPVPNIHAQRNSKVTFPTRKKYHSTSTFKTTTSNPTTRQTRSASSLRGNVSTGTGDTLSRQAHEQTSTEASSTSRLNVKWLPPVDKNLRSRKATVKRMPYITATDSMRSKYRQQISGASSKISLSTNLYNETTTEKKGVAGNMQTDSFVAGENPCPDKSASVCTVEAIYIDKRDPDKKAPIPTEWLSAANGTLNTVNQRNGLTRELVLADSNADCFVSIRSTGCSRRLDESDKSAKMAFEGQSDCNAEEEHVTYSSPSDETPVDKLKNTEEPNSFSQQSLIPAFECCNVEPCLSNDCTEGSLSENAGKKGQTQPECESMQTGCFEEAETLQTGIEINHVNKIHTQSVMSTPGFHDNNTLNKQASCLNADEDICGSLCFDSPAESKCILTDDTCYVSGDEEDVFEDSGNSVYATPAGKSLMAQGEEMSVRYCNNDSAEKMDESGSDAFESFSGNALNGDDHFDLKQHPSPDIGEMNMSVTHGLKRCPAKSKLVRHKSAEETPFFEAVQNALNSRRNTVPIIQVCSDPILVAPQTAGDDTNHFDRCSSLPVIQENHQINSPYDSPGQVHQYCSTDKFVKTSSEASISQTEGHAKFYIEDMPCSSDIIPPMTHDRRSMSPFRRRRPKSADYLLDDGEVDELELSRTPSGGSLSSMQLSPSPQNQSGFGHFRSILSRTFSFKDRKRNRRGVVSSSDNIKAASSMSCLPTQVNEHSPGMYSRSKKVLSDITINHNVSEVSLQSDTCDSTDRNTSHMKTPSPPAQRQRKTHPVRRKSNDVSPIELERIAAEVRKEYSKNHDSGSSLETPVTSRVCDIEVACSPEHLKSGVKWAESVEHQQISHEGLNYKKKNRLNKQRARTDLGSSHLISQVLKKHENNNVLDNNKNRRMSTPHPIKNRKKNKPVAVKKIKPLVKSWSVPDNLNQSHKWSNRVSVSGNVSGDAGDIFMPTKRWSATDDTSDKLSPFQEVSAPTYAEALWDHVTMDHDELGFRAGDVIEVSDMSDKDWWWGAMSDLEGWFPAAFVRLRANQEDTAEEFVQRVKDGAVDTRTVMRRYSISFVSNDQARTNVVREILQAERDYVKQLNDVVEGYVKQARSRPGMFSAQSISTIFGNIEEIRDNSKEFLEKLELCIDYKQFHQSEIGKVFLSHSNNFELYSDYCNNHPAACEELGKLQEKDKYKHFFEACRLLQQMIDIPLEGFLLTPIQKICKYPLQLAELLKYTHSHHKDLACLQEALVKMKKMALLINERKRRMESLEKIAEWQKTVEAWEGPDLLDTSTQLIHSGELSKVNSNGWSQDRNFFLFDHLLVYCKKDLLKRGSFCFKGRINIGECDVIPVEDGRVSDFGVSVKNAWKLHDKVTDKWYLLHTKIANEKEKWLAAFKRERKCVRDDEEEGLQLPKSLKMGLSALPQKPKGKDMKTHRNTYPSNSHQILQNIPARVTLPRAISSQDNSNKHKKPNWFTFSWKKSKK